jgi:hypothetical protein
MLRVALFPCDETGCGRYRMRYPAAAAESESIRPVFPPGSRRVLEQIAEGRIEVDVAVFQRPAHRAISEYIPWIQRRGVAVVVEIDDDFAASHPQGGIFREMHPTNRERNWHHIRRAVALADLVTVATPALAARYGGAKARVLPNFVPAELLDVQAERDGRTLGWAAAPETHIGDLAVTRGGVADAIEKTGARFLHVGPPDGSVQRAARRRYLAARGLSVQPLEKRPEGARVRRARRSVRRFASTGVRAACARGPLPDRA